MHRSAYPDTSFGHGDQPQQLRGGGLAWPIAARTGVEATRHIAAPTRTKSVACGSGWPCQRHPAATDTRSDRRLHVAASRLRRTTDPSPAQQPSRGGATVVQRQKQYLAEITNGTVAVLCRAFRAPSQRVWRMRWKGHRSGSPRSALRRQTTRPLDRFSVSGAVAPLFHEGHESAWRG
jgi:hypothetical protein